MGDVVRGEMCSNRNWTHDSYSIIIKSEAYVNYKGLGQFKWMRSWFFFFIIII